MKLIPRPAGRTRLRIITLAIAALTLVLSVLSWIGPHQSPAPSPVAYFCPYGQHVTGVKAGWPECSRWIAAAPAHGGGTPWAAIIIIVVLVAAGGWAADVWRRRSK